MRALRLTPLAEQDLDDIWSYVAQDSPEAADRLVDAIHERCVRLVDVPEIGRHRDDLAVGVRSVIHGNYVVFYLVTAEAITIVRVLHGARDIEALF